MVIPTARTHTLAAPELQLSTRNRSQPAQSQSFAGTLRETIGRISNSPERRSLTANSLPPVSQPVTRRDPVTVGPTSGSSQPAGLNGLVIKYPSSTPSSTSSSPDVSLPSPSFDQLYWSSQPAPVRQLQDIQDPSRRAQLAGQLQQQGYSIDVPIMVWGWDPATTMAARQSFGYTWVPSAGQQPVQVAPGLVVGGASSYDPNHPPAGSITV